MELVFESIDGTGTTYEFTVDGEIVDSANVENADSVGDSYASGSVWVQGARDVFQIRGSVESLSIDGTAKALVDGTPIAGGVRRQTRSTSESKTAEVAIYSSKKLLDENGRIPERTVADYLAGAFDHAEFDYEITYHYPALLPTDEVAHCSGFCLEWFANESLPFEAKDSNVLLVSSDGGGCGYIGGNRCTTPGAQITERIPYELMGKGPIHGSLHANLHEVAHNLGAAHDHDAQETGAQHWGMGYNKDGFWHRTPTVGGNGCENDCGEHIEKRRYSPAVFHQYYHSCAVDRFSFE